MDSIAGSGEPRAHWAKGGNRGLRRARPPAAGGGHNPIMEGLRVNIVEVINPRDVIFTLRVAKRAAGPTSITFNIGEGPPRRLAVAGREAPVHPEVPLLLRRPGTRRMALIGLGAGDTGERLHSVLTPMAQG